MQPRMSKSVAAAWKRAGLSGLDIIEHYAAQITSPSGWPSKSIAPYCHGSTTPSETFLFDSMDAWMSALACSTAAISSLDVLLPSFLIGFAVAVVVSLLDKKGQARLEGVADELREASAR